MPNACMVVHATYPDDARVRREAETLLGDGWQVDVVCIRGSGEPPVEVCNGATVYRLPVQRHRGQGLAVYLLEYAKFFALASYRIMRLHLRRGYDVVQVHNMPDFLVFTALAPRLLGARAVLDIHDLVPELYAARFAGGADNPAVRLTRWVERASIAFADYVLTAGEPFRRRLLARGVAPEKLTVIMNSADPQLFHPLPLSPAPRADRFTLVYHGGLYERYGLDIAIRAIAQLRDQIPELRLLIYGEGEASDDLARLVAELHLEEQVQLCGYVAIDEIPERIAGADLGVVPYRSNPFTDMLYPTKAFECLAMNIPVITSRTEAMAELFAGIDDMFFEPENVTDLAQRIASLYQSPERRRRLLHDAQAAYAPYAWENQRREYTMLLRRLIAPQHPVPHTVR
ncbi:MAG TPA: glycosyltransferase family 4 protein [Roseiflexaceae bacterium]|nr:glycosyltransferase family 4 protein [Roseiflexaceae bacterium]